MSGLSTRYPWQRKLLLPGAFALVFCLGGCGGGGPSGGGGVSASKQISAAQDALKNAEYAASKNSFSEAESCVETARRKISEARIGATVNDKARLDDLSKQLSTLVASIDQKKLAWTSSKRDKKEMEEQNKKLAELDGDKPKDDEAGKKKAEADAAAQKKLAAEAAKRKADDAQRERDQKLLAEKKTETVKKKHDEEDGDAPAGTAAAPVAPGEKPVAAAPVKVGPYKTHGANPPKLSIDEVRVKGHYVLAYIQVFNQDVNVGKRVGSIDVVFKDAGNAVLFDRTGTFEFSGFRADLGDPTEQTDNKCAVTGGSHEVPAGGVLQLVSVGHDTQRAGRAKKAAVTVNFEDGTTWSDSGPGSALDVDKPAMRGLK